MVTLISFGFKYHRPPANNYIDVSFIKNPARQDKWNLFSFIDNEMIEFVENQPGVKSAIESLSDLIIMISAFDDDVRFAFGCSAGRHRSPIFANLLADRLRDKGVQAKVKHLELEFGNMEVK